jgi:hypothetical protein
LACALSGIFLQEGLDRFLVICRRANWSQLRFEIALARKANQFAVRGVGKAKRAYHQERARSDSWWTRRECALPIAVLPQTFVWKLHPFVSAPLT